MPAFPQTTESPKFVEVEKDGPLNGIFRLAVLNAVSFLGQIKYPLGPKAGARRMPYGRDKLDVPC